MYMHEYVKLYMSMTAIFLKVQIQVAFSAFYTEKDNKTFVYLK